MPIREFADAEGVQWRVWSTTPMTTGVAGSFRAGWLTFEAGAQRRRLTPIPADWEQASPLRLCELCTRAEPVSRTPHTGSWRIESRDS